MRVTIALDPLVPMVQIYEKVYSDFKDKLTGIKREEFVQLCPILKVMERSLYRLVIIFCSLLSSVL
jgi:hypothetical protein